MIPLLILFIIFYTNTKAQDSVYTLAPVEITAGRTVLNNFQSYELINLDDIQKGETGLSLNESLYPIPGLIISDRNNPSMGDKISIRGIGSRASFGVRGIKILLDNIPMTLPDGQSQTNNIDLLSTGKIEILKGPASSLYGNASGGVLNLRTEIPSNDPILVSPQIILGENNLRKYSLKVSGTIDDHQYLVNAVHTNYEGYREHSALKTFQINSVYRTNIAKSLNLSTVINYFNAPYLQNPSSLDKRASEEMRTTAREFVKLQGAGEKADQLQSGITVGLLTEQFSLESTVYYIHRNLMNPIPGRIIDLKRNAGGFRSTAKTDFQLLNYKINLTGGLDFELQNDKRVEFINNGLLHLRFSPDEVFSNLNYGEKLIDQKEEISSVAPYFSAGIFFNESFGIMGAIRNDNYSFTVRDQFGNNSGKRILSHWSPAAGILFKTETGSRIYFNYSTSFQTPTAAEFSNREDGLSGFNTDLQPETINQFELGGDYYSDKIRTRFSAAIYLMDFNNLLISYQSAFSEEIFYRNAGKAVNKGIEIIAETILNNHLSWSFSYSNMDFTFKEYMLSIDDNAYQLSGNYIPGIPQEVLTFSLNYSMGVGIWLRGGLQWNDSYYANDFNGPPPGSNSPEIHFVNESFLNIDLRSGYYFKFSFTEGNIFLGVNNILDKKYNGSVVSNAAGERFFEPAPGRNFYLGTALNF